MDNARYVLGGAVWINLVNTVNKRGVDLLDERAHAEQWLAANHLLRNADSRTAENDVLFAQMIAELRSLRDLCGMILTDLEQGGLGQERIEQLQSLVGATNVRLALVQAEEQLELNCLGITLLDDIRYQIVHSIVETMQHVPRERIRACEHDECILHFIDTSKSGKRRWCSMETCGNRQKAAEFYARKKQKQ